MRAVLVVLMLVAAPAFAQQRTEVIRDRHGSLVGRDITTGNITRREDRHGNLVGRDIRQSDGSIRHEDRYGRLTGTTRPR